MIYQNIAKKSDRVSFIKQRIQESDGWLIRALVALYKCQTADEQTTMETRLDNKVGFNSADARFLTGCARRAVTLIGNEATKMGSFKASQYFRPETVAKMRQRLVKYAGQLERMTNK